MKKRLKFEKTKKNGFFLKIKNIKVEKQEKTRKKWKKYTINKHLVLTSITLYSPTSPFRSLCGLIVLLSFP